MKSCFLLFFRCGFFWLFMGAFVYATPKKVKVEINDKGRTATLHYFQFKTKEVKLLVLDQGGIENQTWRSLGDAMEKNGCIAGCNGGFFDPKGNPLGQFIAGGQKVGRFSTKGSLTSGVVYQSGGQIYLERSKSYLEHQRHSKDLLQSGPFLVENQAPVKGLSNGKTAMRTFIATDGKGRWAIGYIPFISLKQLSLILTLDGNILGFKVEKALNLDGGSSSGFWAKRKSYPLYLREFAKVRNFIGICKREGE